MSLNSVQLSRIDLNLLVLFQVVADEAHVGRAAARLNLTPSAVSHGLGRLRALLSDPLFLRTARGVVPTARALALREPVRDILARVHGLISTAMPFDPATAVRRFVVAAPDAVLASATGPLMESIAATAPHIDIGLVHVMPGSQAAAGTPWADCLAGLENRVIDLALLPLRRTPPRFEARHLYEEDFVVAMRADHPFARAPSLEAFCAAGHLLVSLSAEPAGFVDDILAERGLKRRVALTAPSFAMALLLLAGSDALCVLPRRFVRRHAARLNLVFAELPFSRLADPIQAIATKAALMDAGVAWLMATVDRLHAAD